MAELTPTQGRILRHLADGPDHGRHIEQRPRGRIDLGDGLVVNFRTLLDLCSAGLVDWPGDQIKSPVWITDAGKVALGG